MDMSFLCCFCCQRFWFTARVSLYKSENDVDSSSELLQREILTQATSGFWGWSNGENTLSQYSNWAVGEPSGPLKGEFCVFCYNGAWYDVPCSRSYYFTCYNESTGYIMIAILRSWRDAQSYCRQYHTDLAIARSPEEQNQINAVVGAGIKVWIGLSYDYWQWSDQWSLFYRNWDAGYTSQSLGFGDCVVMSTVSGKWIQSLCTDQRPFICYGDFIKQTVRLSLSHDGQYSLTDSSLQTVILNKISEKLKSAGLESYSNITWRRDEGGKVFHPESKRTAKSNNKCDGN